MWFKRTVFYVGLILGKFTVGTTIDVEAVGLGVPSLGACCRTTPSVYLQLRSHPGNLSHNQFLRIQGFPCTWYRELERDNILPLLFNLAHVVASKGMCKRSLCRNSIIPTIAFPKSIEHHGGLIDLQVVHVWLINCKWDHCFGSVVWDGVGKCPCHLKSVDYFSWICVHVIIIIVVIVCICSTIWTGATSQCIILIAERCRIYTNAFLLFFSTHWIHSKWHKSRCVWIGSCIWRADFEEIS